MSYKSTSRLPTTTDDAVKLFFPGQKVSLKPLDGYPVVTFTVCKLFTPVTKSVVVVAKPDSDTEHPEQVVIKIFDPRYIDDRISRIPSRLPSYPWNLANERAATIARSQNAKHSIDDLGLIICRNKSKDLGGEDLAIHYSFKEEWFYRKMMECYDSELEAYECLEHLQGSAIPRFVMGGEFLPPDERAIRPRAIVLEYIPSVDLADILPAAITPALCAQVVSAFETFPSYGVIHNDVSVTNIHFTPPERPVRAVVMDFGLAAIRREGASYFNEESWMIQASSDVHWARRIVEGMAAGDRRWVPSELRV